MTKLQEIEALKARVAKLEEFVERLSNAVPPPAPQIIPTTWPPSGWPPRHPDMPSPFIPPYIGPYVPTATDGNTNGFAQFYK